jgi:hypothetical protein
LQNGIGRKDQLAENLNLMLGRIEELIGEVKQVADRVARASGAHACATGRRVGRLCVAQRQQSIKKERSLSWIGLPIAPAGDRMSQSQSARKKAMV